MTRLIAPGVALMIATLRVTAVPQPLDSSAAAGPADLPRAPARLSETGLYVAGTAEPVDPGNRQYAPQYPLWSDGLAKRRWVYLPPGSSIDGTDELDWQFPVGARFWKEFAQNGRKIETRLIWKATDTRWVFASYVWNGEGTDALLAPEEGLPALAEIAPGRRHSIPSQTDCVACHGTERPVLGFNALQLSPDRDPNAIHAEALQPGMITLKELTAGGLLRGSRADLPGDPPRIRTSNPATRAVLGYLAANCSMCHNGTGEIAALGPVIRYGDLLRDGDAVAGSLIGQPTGWQVPAAADGRSVLVHPGEPDLSAILVRMRSRSPSSQMPPLGTVVRDQQAVEAIARWITTLTQDKE